MRQLVGIVGLLLALAPAALAQGQPPRVVVVAIDQKTQEALGPFGGAYRARHAKLIEALNAGGVRGIGLDVYFPENPEQVPGTTALANAAKASRAPVVLSVLTELQGDETVVTPNAAVIREAGIRQGAVMSRAELLVSGAPAEGLEVRTGETTIVAESGGFRALSLELGLATGTLTAEDVAKLVQPVTVGVNTATGVKETVDAIRPSLSDPSRLTTVSYVDVLEGRVDPSLLRGALVLVGIDDGVNDVVASPNPAAPGVESVSGVYLHAAALQRAIQLAVQRRAAARAAGSAGGGGTEPAPTPGLLGGVRAATAR